MFVRGVEASERIANMSNVFFENDGSRRRLSVGRPRWENLLVVAGLVVFWAGVIMKIIG